MSTAASHVRNLKLDRGDCPHPARSIAGVTIALAADRLYRAEFVSGGVAIRRWSWGGRDWSSVVATVRLDSTTAQRFVEEFNADNGERRW